MAIYLDSKLDYSPLDLHQFCEEQHGEFTGIAIKSLNLVVITMYRSPSGNFDRFFYLFELCMCYILTLGQSVVIGTDHNVNPLTHPSEALEFRNILRGVNLYFSIDEPTRGDSPLDTVLTSIDSRKYNASVSVDQLSDHKHVLFSLTDWCTQNDTNLANPTKAITVRKFDESSLLSFLELLSCQTEIWHNEILLLNSDPNASWNQFFVSFKHVFDQCFPLIAKTTKPTRNIKVAGAKTTSWYTPELAEFKDFILVISDLSKCRPHLIPALRGLRREYRLEVKRAKQAAVANSIMRAPNPCKAAWDYINKCKTPPPAPVKTFCTPNEFNSFFLESVDDLISSCISVAPNGPNLSPDAFLDVVPYVPFNFTWQPVEINDILKIVSSFKSSRTKDFYDMSVDLLKMSAHIVAPIIRDIVNSSLINGVFPDMLKVSRTVPVYKKGAKDSMGSYRPISIIPVFAKIFEAIMLEQLCGFFEEHRLLVPAQFGFRRGMSTVQAVDFLVQEILNGFECKNFTSVMLCDLSRAFDCVSHEILLKKFERYGVRGDALSILASYLSDRSQAVAWNGSISLQLTVKHGVPQGSMLGPFLFIVSINDLYNKLSGNVLLYADDTTLFSSHSDFSVAKETIQELLEVASSWFSLNRLSLNKSKTQETAFSLCRDIDLGSPVKLLGFVMDPRLEWSAHIDSLCCKLSRVIYLLRRLKAEMPNEFVRVAYFAFFHSHLVYGTRIWGHSPAIHRVLLLQKKAVRVLCGALQLDHCKPLFVQQNIMTVNNVYIYQCLIEIKKQEVNLPLNSDVHSHVTRNSMNVHRFRCRLNKTLNCFPVTGIRFYNAIPLKLRQSPLNCFVRTLKAWLLANPFYSQAEFWNADKSNLGLVVL